MFCNRKGNLFGKYLKPIQKYDGIFLIGLDINHNTLYIIIDGDSTSNPPIPFRYWELDFSNNSNLLNSVLSDDVKIYDLIVNSTIPSRVVQVVDYEYGEDFYHYLKEDRKYIPELPDKNFKINIY